MARRQMTHSSLTHTPPLSPACALQSVVQSYLEGVGWGLEQLREARAELRDVSHTLQKVTGEAQKAVSGAAALEELQQVADNHCQLLAAVSNLPRLYLGEWC